MFFDKLDINNKVTQSNDLVIAQYKLSLNEQKIMLCLISLIQPTDTDFKVYKLKIKDLLDILDIKNKKFYKEVQIITGNLIRRWITFTSPERDLQINWLSSAEYFKNEWYVELSIDPKLKPYLLNLKNNFLSYDFSIAIRFRSAYTIRIFQLLLANYRKYKKNNFIFTLDFLRWLLNLEEDQYKLFSNFKARVLEPAKVELESKHKKFFFEYKEMKDKNKVHSIEFIIKTFEWKNNEGMGKIACPFMSELLQWIPNETIDELIESYWINIIQNNYKYFKNELDNWKIRNKNNPSSFLIKAINNNYAWNLPNKELLKSKKELEKEKERIEQEESERKKKFELYLKDLFKTKYSSLSEDRKKILEYDFIQHLNSTSIWKSIFKKIKINWFTDTFLEFYLFSRDKVLTENEINFKVQDSIKTLF